jgi:hypothetical protein
VTNCHDESFTIRFGEAARTIDYADDVGALRFTFDVKREDQSGMSTLVLEHWAKATRRDARYDQVFHRIRKFLESRGYRVEIWGK